MPHISPLSPPQGALSRVGVVPAALPDRASDPFGALMAFVGAHTGDAVPLEVTPDQTSEAELDLEAEVAMESRGPEQAESLDPGEGGPAAAPGSPPLLVSSEVIRRGDAALGDPATGMDAQPSNGAQDVAPAGSNLPQAGAGPGPGPGGTGRVSQMHGGWPAAGLPRPGYSDQTNTDNPQGSGAALTIGRDGAFDGIRPAASDMAGQAQRSGDRRGREGLAGVESKDPKAAVSADLMATTDAASTSAAARKGRSAPGPAPALEPASGPDPQVPGADGPAGNRQAEGKGDVSQRGGADGGARTVAVPSLIEDAPADPEFRSAGGAALLRSTDAVPQGGAERTAQGERTVHRNPHDSQAVQPSRASDLAAGQARLEALAVFNQAPSHTSDGEGRARLAALDGEGGASPYPHDPSSRRGVDLAKHGRPGMSPQQDAAAILAEPDQPSSHGPVASGQGTAIRFEHRVSPRLDATPVDGMDAASADGLVSQIGTGPVDNVQTGHPQIGIGHGSGGWLGKGLAPPGGSTLNGQAATARGAMQPSASVPPQDVTVREGATELSLDPEELGRIDIRIERREDGLSIVMRAERGESADLMRRHADVLHRELANSGITNARLDFGQGGGSHPQHRGHPGDQPADRGDLRRMTPAIAPPDRPVVAAAGRVDLRL